MFGADIFICIFLLVVYKVPENCEREKNGPILRENARQQYTFPKQATQRNNLLLFIYILKRIFVCSAHICRPHSRKLNGKLKKNVKQISVVYHLQTLI